MCASPSHARAVAPLLPSPHSGRRISFEGAATPAPLEHKQWLGGECRGQRCCGGSDGLCTHCPEKFNRSSDGTPLGRTVQGEAGAGSRRPFSELPVILIMYTLLVPRWHNRGAHTALYT